MKKINKKILFSFLISLLFVNKNIAQTTLVAAGSSWKYLDNGSNQGTSWIGPGFSDVSWKSGNAELGYGDGDEVTVVGYGPNSKSKYITTYFRKTISVANASAYGSYTLNVKRDDGIIVYINGVERYRNNMPAGTIGYTTWASTTCADDGETWYTATLPSGSLVTGSNTIAVEVHQCYPDNSDVTFEFELLGTAATDVTAPTISALAPADNTTSVSASSNLVLTFNENIQKGSGNITVKEGGVVTQTINVTSSTVTVSGATVTIDPSNFANSGAVNIEMPAGVFKDIAGNNFAGITSTTSWNFSVAAAADVTAPTISSLSPADNATSVSAAANLVITFNEAVQKGTGNITVKEGGVIKQTIAVTSSTVTVSGAVVTIDPSNFTNSAAVNIEMPAGTFKDIAGNNFAGITSTTAWNFSVETTGRTTTLSRGPYLQMGTPNSIVIRWRSGTAVDSKVSYGLTAGSLTSSVSSATSVTDHEIQLTGLTPNTKYFYSVGSSSQVLQGDANNYFVTAPTVGTEKKTRIWVNGDCGNNSTNQKNVRDKFISYMGANYTDVWLLLGDNAYENGTDSEYQTKFFDIYKDKMLKQTVLWPSPGNHDYANSSTRANDHVIPYFDMFTLPKSAQAGGVASNTEAFYSYNHANIHFISLDSYGKEGNTYKLYDTLGPQVLWLKKDLAANTQKWTIVYWHHPPYSMGSHNSDTESDMYRVRQNLLTILERYKVDLILCGHSHNYERSKLMKGHFGNESTFSSSLHNISSSSGKYDGSSASCPYVKTSASSYNGTVYVVAGSSGQLSSTMQASFPHAAMYYSSNTYAGSMVLEIEANRLDAKWVCTDGTIKDNFTIEKDVSIKKNISIVRGNSTTLSASWIGNYSWTTGATTRAITVAPTATTTYVARDGMNCLADTFNVTVTAARPMAAASTMLTAQSAVLKTLALKVYPNPVTSQSKIEISTPQAGSISLEIFDITGRKIKSLISNTETNGTYNYVLNAGDEQLREGVYMLKLAFGKQQLVQKIMVHKN